MKKILQLILAIIIMLIIALNTASANSGNTASLTKELKIKYGTDTYSKQKVNGQTGISANKNSTAGKKKSGKEINCIYDNQLIPVDISKEYISKRDQFKDAC